MSVRYKFKNDRQYDTVRFDSFHITVRDLKKAICRQKKLRRVTDFDLQVTNEQTGSIYDSEDTLILKNSTLTIARIPLPRHQKKVWEEEKIMTSNSGGGGIISLASTKGEKSTVKCSNSEHFFVLKNLPLTICKVSCRSGYHFSQKIDSDP